MNKRILFLVVTSFFFINTSVNGKNDTIRSKPWHGVSINSGLVNQMIRDEVMSPFLYKKAGMPIDVCYQYAGTTTHQLFSAQFYKLRLKSDIPDYDDFGLLHHVESRTFDIRYAYLRKVQALPKTGLSFYLGGELNAFLNLRDHFFTSTNNQLMVDCFNSFSISALFEKRLKDKTQVLYFDVSVPVLSYVLMRQTYNANVGEKIESLDLGKNVLHQLIKDGDLVSMPKLIKVRAGLTYEKYFSKYFGYNLKYRVDYYKFTQYDDLFYSKNLSNQFLIGFIFKL